MLSQQKVENQVKVLFADEETVKLFILEATRVSWRGEIYYLELSNDSFRTDWNDSVSSDPSYEYEYRYEYNEENVMIKIPVLSYSELGDGTEETMDFEPAKNKLSQIIQLAIASALIGGCMV